MAERSAPPTGETPSGMPPDGPEDEPMGPPERAPEARTSHGAGPMRCPGIPTEGDPPAAS